jgi:hypothetical protein
MRIEPPIVICWFLCGCAPTSAPVAQAPVETCAKAFDVIAPPHAIPNTTAAYAAAAYTCEYARAETQALSLCDAPFPKHSLAHEPAGAADHHLRKRTLSALIDAELFGERLAGDAEALRTANGGPQKLETGCQYMLDEFPPLLAQREQALRALTETGRY